MPRDDNSIKKFYRMTFVATTKDGAVGSFDELLNLGEICHLIIIPFRINIQSLLLCLLLFLNFFACPPIAIGAGAKVTKKDSRFNAVQAFRASSPLLNRQG